MFPRTQNILNISSANRRIFGAHTMAPSHSSVCKCPKATSKATKDDEQAVSNVRLGPVKFSEKEMRFAMTDKAHPVEEN